MTIQYSKESVELLASVLYSKVASSTFTISHITVPWYCLPDYMQDHWKNEAEVCLRELCKMMKVQDEN